MGNAADTLVARYPTRVAQLDGPVYDYFKYKLAGKRLNGTEQDLYMTVFHPASRRVSPDSLFPADVRRDNPGIDTPQDYIDLVNSKKSSYQPTAQEYTAMKNLAGKIGMKSWEPIYKLINFESGWNPQATNKISGARGLIQFMPFIAAEMGFKKTLGLVTLLLLAGGGFYLGKRLKLF